MLASRGIGFPRAVVRAATQRPKRAHQHCNRTAPVLERQVPVRGRTCEKNKARKTVSHVSMVKPAHSTPSTFDVADDAGIWSPMEVRGDRARPRERAARASRAGSRGCARWRNHPQRSPRSSLGQKRAADHSTLQASLIRVASPRSRASALSRHCRENGSRNHFSVHDYAGERPHHQLLRPAGSKGAFPEIRPSILRGQCLQLVRDRGAGLRTPFVPTWMKSAIMSAAATPRARPSGVIVAASPFSTSHPPAKASCMIL